MMKVPIIRSNWGIGSWIHSFSNSNLLEEPYKSPQKCHVGFCLCRPIQGKIDQLLEKAEMICGRKTIPFRDTWHAFKKLLGSFPILDLTYYSLRTTLLIAVILWHLSKQLDINSLKEKLTRACYKSLEFPDFPRLCKS